MSCPDCGKDLVRTESEGLILISCFCGYESNEALDWLKSPDLLGNFVRAITGPGSANPLVGEEDLATQLLLILVAKGSAEVRGLTGAGKSSLVDHVLSVFPREWWEKVGGLTDKALRYWSEGKRILYVAERGGFTSGKQGEETTAEKDIKLSISEGEISFLVPEKVKDEGGNVRQETQLRKVVIDSMIFTTTEVSATPELENRIFVLNVKDDQVQNQIVRDSQLEGARRFSWEKVDFTKEKVIAARALRYIWKQSPEVIVPFTGSLKSILRTESSIVRRNTPKVLDLIKAGAKLHYLQREKGPGEKGIIATPEDLETVLRTGQRSLFPVLEGIPEKCEIVLEICRTLEVSKLDITSENVLLNAGDKRAELGTKSTVRKALHYLAEKGVLTERDERKGKLKVYDLQSGENPLVLDVPAILESARTEYLAWLSSRRVAREQTERGLTSIDAQPAILMGSASNAANPGPDSSRAEIR